MRAVLLSLMLLLPALASATDVQGHLMGDLVWKRSGNPYVLKGDVTVGWGSKLTLEPGVQVVAAATDGLRAGVDPQRVELIVDGTLVVRGNAALPVGFDAEGGPGSWYGIRVRGGRGTVIDGAYLLQTVQGIQLGMPSVVRNTSISATARDCLQVNWGQSTLENNELSGCGGRSAGDGGWVNARDPRGSKPSLPESTPPPVMRDVRQVSFPTPQEAPPRVASPAPPSEQGPRGGALAAPSRDRLPERAPEARPPQPSLAVDTPARAAPGKDVVSTPTPVVTPRGSPSPISPPPPTSPARPAGGRGFLTGPSTEECAAVPQVGESPACPGIRRWRKNQERSGETAPEALWAPPPMAPRPALALAGLDPGRSRGNAPRAAMNPVVPD